MRGLLIAEKPSVMRAIQAVYNQMQGYPDTLEFAAFHGHLLGLKEPQEIDADWGSPWSAEQLPMFPGVFEYKVVDRASAERLYKQIKGGSYDFLINACDAGREGELIFWSFYETFQLQLPVKRYWANSNVNRAITSALQGLLPSNRFAGLRRAANLRAQIDWLVGMNFSRAASLSTEITTAIGRVQTPTLKMVVDRELEIRNFKVEDFWELKVQFETQKGELLDTVNLIAPEFKESKYKQRKVVETVQNLLKPTGKIVRVKKEQREAIAPTLFSLAELQKSANLAYKMTPERTLDMAQKLYESGYITYPRTDSRYLPLDIVPELLKHLKALYDIPDIGPYAQAVTQSDVARATTGKVYVDDGKIEDHHAIIPTEEAVPWETLSDDEKKVYLLIAKQFVAIFMGPYKADTTAVLVRVGNNLFRCDGIVVTDKGYVQLYKTKRENVVLPDVEEGDIVNLKETTISVGQTRPPARYTPRTLIAAMQNAGRAVSEVNQRSILKEKAGLGTSATRAKILSDMIDRGYLSLFGNQYTPSDYAIQLIGLFGKHDFCSPVLTAIWEEKLKKVEDNTYLGNIETEIADYISAETAALLANRTSLKGYRYIQVGTCPLCGGRVLQKKSYYVCDCYKAETDPCEFIIPQEIMGCRLSKEDIALLLAGKPTRNKKLKKKDGTIIEHQLVLDEQKRLSFYHPAERTKGLGKCPLCEGIVQEGREFYVCSRRSCGCSFVQKKTIMGAKLEPKDMQALLEGKVTRDMKFTWRSGGQGFAALKLRPDGKMEWIFKN